MPEQRGGGGDQGLSFCSTPKGQNREEREAGREDEKTKGVKASSTPHFQREGFTATGIYVMDRRNSAW